MSKIFASLAAGAALVSGAAVATAEDAQKDDPIICKRDKMPNSRVLTKTCFTRSQWLMMAEENKRAYGELRDRPIIEIRK